MTTAEERVRRLLAGAARLSRPDDPLGRSLRAALESTCPLSREGVELALTRHLEVDPSPGELRALLDRAVPVPRGHVALSAQVFVGALRAIAVALAASPDVTVRPSRRDPEMTLHLARAAPGLFRIAARLEPRAGETLWSYGGDAALSAIDRALPGGVRHLPHGPGIGVVVVDAAVLGSPGALVELAEAIARDVVPFDQRGCLSPRIVLVEGPGEAARELGVEIARALDRAERAVPPGAATEEERAAIRRYRDSVLVSGELLPAGS
ncbi:MAG: proline dehydrogenase, partial [Deltaproteobacteria bacterium]|nr:proline dehydrogenase [Deltaproteobacteria bacterium]